MIDLFRIEPIRGVSGQSKILDAETGDTRWAGPAEDAATELKRMTEATKALRKEIARKPSTAKSDKQRAARDALAQAVSDIERQIAADKGELAAHLAAVKHSGEESKRYKKKVAALEKDLKSKKAKLRKLL